ncbi:MAG: Death-on-curing protein [Candidatus Thorarchaeota archaeon]|nr:MAG: Death-on-curing protein [Candidatus Thorarchaeota archaeon]
MRGAYFVRYLTYDEILSIHDRLIEFFGGESGVFSVNALENCVSLPMMSVFGTETNPTIWSKAAALLYCILIRHPFVDGNKRTAWTAAKLFLYLNGYDLQVDVDDA